MAGVVVGTDPVQDIIAFGVLVIAYLGYRNGRIARQNTNKLDDVHALVNQQLTDSVDRRDVAEARTRVLEAEKAESDTP